MEDKRRFWIMVLYIFIGAVLGTVLGIALQNIFPIFGYYLKFGFSPFTLRLIIADITLGFNFYVNVGTLIGVIIFFYLFLIL
jgi:hypothetical protein